MVPLHLRALLAGLAVFSTALAQSPPSQQVPQVQLPQVNALPVPPARIPIYYPPTPPAPGGEIDPVGPLMAPNWNAPEGLADYVGERFYPMLGSRLAERDLPRRMRTRLDAYRARRDGWLAAGRAAWLQGKALPEGHADVAKELEIEAEALAGEFLQGNYHWNMYRNWSVGPGRNADTPANRKMRTFHLYRAASFYQPWLTTEQRGLLWDYVLRLEEAGLLEPVEASEIRAGGTFPFLPAGAQLRLPWDLPEPLARRLRTFAESKLTLQRALAELIVEVDSETVWTRQKRFEELARVQAEPMAELERLAEALRVELASLPAEEPLVLPAELAGQARDFRRKRESIHADLAARLRATRAEVLRYRPGAERLMWESNFKSGAFVPVTSLGPMTQLMARVVETPRQQGRAERAREKLEEAVAAFARETEERRKSVEAEGQALFASAVRAALPNHPEGEPLPPEWEGKVLSILRLAAIAERLPRYELYVVAVARPGLTPAERRVLFGAALRELQLPLPAGVRQPFDVLSTP